MKHIRSSKHYFISFANAGKRDELACFLSEARKALDFYISYLWNNEIKYSFKKREIIFDIKNNLLECPAFISTKGIAFETQLSARALKCISTQACGIIKGVIEERRSLESKIEWLKSKGFSTRSVEKHLNEISFSRPAVSSTIPLEFNSICLELIETDTKMFDAFLECHSLGKAFKKFSLPIKWTRLSNKWKNRGRVMKSFLLSEGKIEIRWEVQSTPRAEGSIVGVDTGINHVAYLSDMQHTTKDKDGHNYNTILDKLERKQKGSKAFQRALNHEKNYINWSINQLNFEGIREVRIEKIKDLRRGKASSRKNSHFKYGAIERKLISNLELLGVLIVLNSSFYNSLRCFSCGYVCSKNRNKEEFNCIACAHSSHADFNAAQNNSITLCRTYSLRYLLTKLKDNEGFFWMANALLDKEGKELTVPAEKR